MRSWPRSRGDGGGEYRRKTAQFSMFNSQFDGVAKSRFQGSDSTLEGHALSWPGMPFIGGTKMDATEPFDSAQGHEPSRMARPSKRGGIDFLRVRQFTMFNGGRGRISNTRFRMSIGRWVARVAKSLSRKGQRSAPPGLGVFDPGHNHNLSSFVSFVNFVASWHFLIRNNNPLRTRPVKPEGRLLRLGGASFSHPNNNPCGGPVVTDIFPNQ